MTVEKREELVAKAFAAAKVAEQMHRFYRGKIQIQPKCAIRGVEDFAIWYTPGVAEACRAIVRDPLEVYEQTNKWNTVAIVTNGTRVLGLGNIGPEAALPVMEGKALLFKYLGGVDAVPICLDARDPEEMIRTTRHLQPAFGGINLEDIEQPACFHILDRLREEMTIPVFHDDQQGTATVTLAGLLNALRIVGKPLADVRIAMVGAGASNIAIARILIAAGADPGNIVMTDSRGILNRRRTELRDTHRQKWTLCLVTNAENLSGGPAEAMRGADVLIALSTPGPDVIKPEWVREMAPDPVVFACANPVPEIWPWDAKEAGARIVATGRSDFPNQINNSLGFPAIFRGALDVRARTITDEMCVAAAQALAGYAQERGLHEDYIVPSMVEWEVYPLVAAAVGERAIAQGVARLRPPREQLEASAREMIRSAREGTRLLMEHGYIPILNL
ncbi:MAG: NADP-dependent malic enzyme [Armatimonadota bacterium]|nr:NADP-dependent malic enzyme [Armatimonadota bacterium]MDR5697008.1 NADP-dependent malic enzyme [Armatimonadota bacterium]